MVLTLQDHLYVFPPSSITLQLVIVSQECFSEVIQSLSRVFSCESKFVFADSLRIRWFGCIYLGVVVFGRCE